MTIVVQLAVVPAPETRFRVEVIPISVTWRLRPGGEARYLDPVPLPAAIPERAR
jgi:hypothetical protein